VVAGGKNLFMTDAQALDATERRGYPFIIAPRQPLYVAAARSLQAPGPVLTTGPGYVSVNVMPLDLAAPRGLTGVPGAPGSE
jgi:hypothetical protein